MEIEGRAFQQQRANIYKILSICYGQPNEEMGKLLEILTGCLEQIQPDLVPYSIAMRDAYSTNGLSSLQVDHARLFVGPFQVLAAPYGSIYLEGNWKVMGESTLDARTHYHNAGLKIHTSLRNPPDHIAVELEFMYFLIFEYLEMEDPAIIKSQEGFLLSHLGRWIASFTELIQKHAQTAFYQSFAAVTEKFVKEDMRLFLAAQAIH